MTAIDPDDHTGLDLLTAVTALDAAPDPRTRRLLAHALDEHQLTVGDVLTSTAASLVVQLEELVSSGRIADYHPKDDPPPAHRTPDDTQRMRLLWSLPLELQVPAATAYAQGVLDNADLRVLEVDTLRAVLRQAVADGRLVNQMHAEEPEAWPAWDL